LFALCSLYLSSFVSFSASRKRKFVGSSSNTSATPSKKLYLHTAVNLNFDDCKVVESQIPKNLIQINADSSEIERRLNCFVEKKREEIDNNNIQDFIVRKDEGEADEFSCARVNSIIFRQKDSKGHLRVHRVKNEYGPQTDFNYKSALDKLMETKCRFNDGSSGFAGDTTGVEERLMNIESHMKLAGTNNFAKASVFERLKVIENKILLLETISPEYAHFLEKAPRHVKPTLNKVVYSNDDVDELLELLQSQVAEQKGA
jgi:molybdopterin synthase catalytic subunit